MSDRIGEVLYQLRNQIEQLTCRMDELERRLEQVATIQVLVGEQREYVVQEETQTW